MTTKSCPTCNRSKQHFDGCSHIECPNRRTYTAAQVGESIIPMHKSSVSEPAYCSSGSMRRVPNIDFEE